MAAARLTTPEASTHLMRAKLVAFSRNTFSSLSKRNFRLYFIGQVISLTGGWMQSVAQAWLMLHLTHSGTALGIAAALQCGPTLFLGPYAGVIGMRFPKRRVLLVTQTAAGLLALGLGALVAANAVQVWMVYALALALGVVNAVDYPIRQSFVFELAGPRELVSAVGLVNTAVNSARVIGPAIAGAVIGIAGLAVCFFVNAASFVAVLVCLVRMRPAEFHRALVKTPEGGVAEGARYAAGTPVVRESLAMMAVIGMLTYEFSVTLPMLVKFTFGGDATGLAYLMSSMGVGAVVGGLLTAGRRGEGLSTLTVSALLFGLTTALAGLAPNIAVATAIMFFVGVFTTRFTALSNSVIQLRACAAMRSRAVALWSTAFIGSSFLGAPLLGWVGEIAGPRWAMGVGAIGGIIAALIGAAGMRRAEQASVAPLECAQLAEKNAS